jgi:signal transduction histidine kinase
MTLLNRIAEHIRQMPIRQKLRLVFILTTAMALLLAGVGILAADSALFYRYLERDLSTFVQVIGDNSTGALAFGDQRQGREALAALRARPHVETACLYQEDGALLALYRREDFQGACPAPQGEGVRRAGASLVASHRVYRNDQRVGFLVLLYDLGEIPERFEIYGGAVLFALVLASVIALIFSAKLRALIAEPILALAGAANTVSESKDYGIRAKKLSDDEIGALADAINQMLDSIQARDAELRKGLDTQGDMMLRLAQLNTDLERSNAELKRSNQDLERFAFVASHDLQEPLRMITTYSQLLVAEQPASGNGSARQHVEYIVNGTRRMRELLGDLLAYTEIAGASEHPAEAVDLNEVLKKVQETLSARIAETGAAIAVSGLPVLSAHESRLTSLFSNLVGNAIKYAGDRPPRVRISAEQGAAEFVFAVADNGIGIAPQYHAKIFEAFRRLHGKTIPGTGIGLAICQRIVERYGGRIWVESEAGAGATFRFTLPKSMAVEKM